MHRIHKNTILLLLISYLIIVTLMLIISKCVSNGFMLNFKIFMANQKQFTGKHLSRMHVIFNIEIQVLHWISFSAIRCLDKVSTSVLPYFNGVASKLIEERGAVEVLSAALAYISGVTTEMKSRSLLSSQPVSYTCEHLVCEKNCRVYQIC